MKTRHNSNRWAYSTISPQAKNPNERHCQEVSPLPYIPTRNQNGKPRCGPSSKGQEWFAIQHKLQASRTNGPQKQGNIANGNVNCMTYNLHLGSIYCSVRFNSHMMASHPGSPTLVTVYVRFAVEEKQVGENLQELPTAMLNHHYNTV